MLLFESLRGGEGRQVLMTLLEACTDSFDLPTSASGPSGVSSVVLVSIFS